MRRKSIHPASSTLLITREIITSRVVFWQSILYIEESQLAQTLSQEIHK
jgi:hypothetical protein